MKNKKKEHFIGGVPIQAKPFLVADLMSEKDIGEGLSIVLVSDMDELRAVSRVLKALCPSRSVLSYPDWQLLPYDRVSPPLCIVEERLKTLHALSLSQNHIVVAITNALLLPTIPPSMLSTATIVHTQKAPKTRTSILQFLEHANYVHVSTVQEPGEYALRGGLIDAFFMGTSAPLRMDFFDEELESIKTFDAATQTSIAPVDHFIGLPRSEVILNDHTIKTFRANYRNLFGAKAYQHELYKSISDGQYFVSAEHWLPLFYDEVASFLDYIDAPTFYYDMRDLDCLEPLFKKIEDAYKFRHDDFMGNEQDYAPLEPPQLYGIKQTLLDRLNQSYSVKMSPFVRKEEDGYDARPLPPLFSKEKSKRDRFEALRIFAETATKPFLYTFSSDGMEDTILSDLKRIKIQPELIQAHPLNLSNKAGHYITHIVANAGFEHKEFFLITELDLYGKRSRAQTKTAKTATAKHILEVSSFGVGDFLIHEEHGVGAYLGLEILKIHNAKHDCLVMEYQGGDKLYIPVENLYVVTYYAAKTSETTVDRLGGNQWQKKRESAKKKIKEIAEKLSKIAAGRKLIEAKPFHKNEFYEKFCSLFPYVETDDQLNAIDDVLNDLSLSTPMDRLICGDVGYGKTEVALRAAFLVASEGAQVAVLSPTTILAKQHFETFQKRFSGFPLKVALVSRFQTAAEAKKIREEMKKGEIDIVIGTHSLLSNQTEFCDLGLLIIDEEQHFGVTQKEKIKSKYPNVHVLSLSATPIPRTMQMAVSGIRDLTLITTPPVERRPIETWVTPYDLLTIKEALLWEKSRGGQSFFVCPRVSDIAHIFEDIQKVLPQFRTAIVHGQLPPKDLERIMMDFCHQKYDLLIATNIIESGLDIPTANTLIVYRSDMFGLAQIYQLRGRVGRSNVQGYAYFTYSENKTLTNTATRRLEVLQSLKAMGGGFQIASYDMDIRGTGNIVGEEQSGQIKDVGVGLYHQMLEEALLELKKSPESLSGLEMWAPQINLGLPVFIPETYIEDESLRFRLYRRLSLMKENDDLDLFSLEMVDRFGKIPFPFQTLIETVALRNLCKTLNIHRIDRGPKGILITFYKDTFKNVDALLGWTADQGGTVKLRPDQKLVIIKSWQEEDLIDALISLLEKLSAKTRKETKD